MTKIEFLKLITELLNHYEPDDLMNWLNRQHPHLAGQTPSSYISKGWGAEVISVAQNPDNHPNKMSEVEQKENP